MLSGYCVTLGLMALYGFLCWRDNKKKEIEEAAWRASIEGQVQDVAEEWKDLTDKKVSEKLVSGSTALMSRIPSSGTPTSVLTVRQD